MSFCTTFYCGLISQFDSVALAEGAFGLVRFILVAEGKAHTLLAAERR